MKLLETMKPMKEMQPFNCSLKLEFTEKFLRNEVIGADNGISLKQFSILIYDTYD